MKIASILFVVIMFASITFGQTTQLSGVIFDPTGAIVVTADIKARDATGKVHVAKSDSKGSYTLNLRPGIYEIGVSQTGFITLKIEEYIVVQSTFGKMNQDFVLFGLSPRAHEPCGYSGAECMNGIEKIVFEVTVKHSPKLKSLEN